MTISALSSSNSTASTVSVTTPHVWTNADNQALLNELTPSDWQLGSASAGHTLNQSSQAQPLMLWQIAAARQSGELSATQPVTVDWLKELKGNQPDSGYVEGIDRAIDYLQSTSSSTSSSNSGLDILA